MHFKPATRISNLHIKMILNRMFESAGFRRGFSGRLRVDIKSNWNQFDRYAEADVFFNKFDQKIMKM